MSSQIVPQIVIIFHLDLEKKSPLLSYLIATEHIDLRWTHCNVYKRICTYICTCTQASQIGDSYRYFRIRLRSNREFYLDNLSWKYFIVHVSKRAMRSWQFASPEIWRVYRERTISKLNKSHKDESQRITSYLILELQKISTISYDFSIVLFVTDRMAVGT